MGLRPGNGNRRGFGGGKSGSIRFRSSSGSKGLAMSALLTTQHHFYVEGSAEVRHSVRPSKTILKNQGGETRSLSFRDVVKLILVNETRIFTDLSPVFTESTTKILASQQKATV